MESLKKPRVQVILHKGETIVNQCAHAALNQGRDIQWFTQFMARTKDCGDADSLLLLLFEEFDIIRDRSEDWT